MWVGTELAAHEARQYLNALAESLGDTRLVAELPVVGRRAFRRTLSEQIGKVLNGQTEPAPALQAAAEKWRGIRNDVGVGKLRDSYRRSLGLEPLP